MGWWKSVAHRMEYVARRSGVDTDLADEVRFHLDSHADDLQRRGLTAEEASAEARREFGSPLRALEDGRQAWQFAWIEHLRSNLRYGLRQVHKNPGFAAIVVVTLALGIGANSAVFSAIDAVLLRPLPVPEGDRLMRIYQRNLKNPITLTAPARLADWDHMNRTFQALTGFYTEDVSETSGDFPEKLTRAFVAPRFLEVWGLAPALGRDFTPDEERDGGPVAVLISDRLWRRRFDADRGAIGRQLRVGAASSPTIVGVLPATFQLLARDVDVWWPAVLTANLAQFRDATWYQAIGRKKTGVSAIQARADLGAVQRQLAEQYPKSDAGLTVDVQPLAAEMSGGLRSSLWLLFGSASVLLLIACVNVAGLLLVRATERRHEMAIRASLGGSGRVIAAQLLTEIGILVVLSALVGLVIASVTGHVFRLLAGNLPRVDEIHMDWRVILFTVVTALGVTMGCGLWPALRVTRGSLESAGLRGWRTQVSGRSRWQWTLVGIQVSLAVVLLASAGLLVRSVQELSRVSPGFDAHRILTFHVSGSYGETTDYRALTQRIDRTLEFLRSIPGIQAAATASALPAVPGRFMSEVPSVPARADSEPKVIADNRFVSPSYFATLQIPLLAGELCQQTSPTAVHTALVNRSFAQAYFAGSTPIGHQFRAPMGPPDTATIQGIVADVREQGLHRAPGPTVYWCFSAPGPAPFFLIRTTGHPAALTDTLRRTLKELEPARAVFGVTPLDDHLDDAYQENRFRTVLLVSFATIAVVLACVGLYGTLSYVVTSRRREVGLRLALGAVRGQIVGRFLTQGFVVSTVACAGGLALSALSARWLSSMLYGVSPFDPVTLAVVAVIVLAGAAVASLVPSARAARVEPMQVLKGDA